MNGARRSSGSIVLLCLSLLIAGWVGIAPGVVHAQNATSQKPEPADVDYKAWEQMANRAADVIEAARASTPALEELRNQLDDWRQKFVKAQGVNATAIKTVRDQLNALGPPPKEVAEAPGVAAQRKELSQQLSRLEQPVKNAQVAQSRAEALMNGVDAIIRERQKQALLRLGPSPVNVVNWPEGASALLGTANDLREEVINSWANQYQREQFQGSLPAVLVLMLLGVLLMTRGRRWLSRLMRRLLPEEVSAGRWIMLFALSLGEWLLPLAGVYALVRAAQLTGLLGQQGTMALDAVMPSATIFLFAVWLAQHIFPRRVVRSLPLKLDEACRQAGRLYGGLAGLVVGIFWFVQMLARGLKWSEAAQNVVMFPVLVLAGLLLWRLARLLLLHSRASARETDGETPSAEENAETFRDRLSRLLSRLLTLVAVVAPILAAVGYVAAAQALLIPTLMSLILLGVLLILQRVTTELYVLVSGNREGAEESLVPVLGGFLLMLLSLPLFALVWGARVAQLQSWWLSFTQGITLGGTRISPSIFLTLAVVFAFGYVVTRLVQGALKNTVLPKTRLDPGGRNAVVSGVGYLGIFLAALIAITTAGIDLSSLAIVAGALSVGIGFGLQNIVSNFVSGIILLIERPISEGDWIEVGGQQGYVRSISVRSTRIETFDRTDVIVPNADLVSGTVTNYTRGNTIGRVIVPVGAAYGTDPRRVEKILQDVAENHPMVLMRPAPYVVFQGFGASSLDFEIRAILRDVNWVLNVKSDMNYEIARRFEEEGIEIPFVQRDIWIRNPEALREGRGQTTPTPENNGAQDSPRAAGTGRGQPAGPNDGTEGAADAEGDT